MSPGRENELISPPSCILQLLEMLGCSYEYFILATARGTGAFGD